MSQVDITGHTLTDYKYKDIEYMAKVQVTLYSHRVMSLTDGRMSSCDQTTVVWVEYDSVECSLLRKCKSVECMIFILYV